MSRDDSERISRRDDREPPIRFRLASGRFADHRSGRRHPSHRPWAEPPSPDERDPKPPAPVSTGVVLAAGGLPTRSSNRYSSSTGTVSSSPSIFARICGRHRYRRQPGRSRFVGAFISGLLGGFTGGGVPACLCGIRSQRAGRPALCSRTLSARRSRSRPQDRSGTQASCLLHKQLKTMASPTGFEPVLPP